MDAYYDTETVIEPGNYYATGPGDDLFTFDLSNTADDNDLVRIAPGRGEDVIEIVVPDDEPIDDGDPIRVMFDRFNTDEDEIVFLSDDGTLATPSIAGIIGTDRGSTIVQVSFGWSDTFGPDIEFVFRGTAGSFDWQSVFGGLGAS
jgi:hypothetical protein